MCQYIFIIVILMIYCLVIFQKDQVKTNIAITVKVSENCLCGECGVFDEHNCLCGECSMNTTMLASLHGSLAFKMTEVKWLVENNDRKHLGH